MRLYIIGNGFDRAHNLKTSYWDFRCYLERYAEVFLLELEKLYGFYLFDFDDYHISRETQNDALMQRKDCLYERLWKSFELSLGQPSEEEFDTVCDSAIHQMDDIESGPIGIEETLNHYFEEQFGFVVKLQEYLLKWVKQIRLNKAIVKKEAIKQCKDYFLTFNYTATLERIYEIPESQICHIHGGVPPYCNVEPIIGHGNRESIRKWLEWKKENDDVFDEGGFSKCKAIADFYKRTLKNTDKILFSNAMFFHGLSEIEEVVVIGHSFGDVDLPYFKKIVEVSGEKVPWLIVYHTDSEKDDMANKAKGLGLTEITLVSSNEYWDR